MDEGVLHEAIDSLQLGQLVGRAELGSSSPWVICPCVGVLDGCLPIASSILWILFQKGWKLCYREESSPKSICPFWCLPTIGRMGRGDSLIPPQAGLLELDLHNPSLS